MDWLDTLRRLHLENRLIVQHDPVTPHYLRAGQKLRQVLRSAQVLGSRVSEQPNAVELATWSPPGHGRGPGFYCCFRLFLDEDRVTLGALFCFYDGTEESTGLKTLESALAFARMHEFRGDDED